MHMHAYTHIIHTLSHTHNFGDVLIFQFQDLNFVLLSTDTWCVFYFSYKTSPGYYRNIFGVWCRRLWQNDTVYLKHGAWCLSQLMFNLQLQQPSIPLLECHCSGTAAGRAAILLPQAVGHFLILSFHGYSLLWGTAHCSLPLAALPFIEIWISYSRLRQSPVFGRLRRSSHSHSELPISLPKLGSILCRLAGP